MSDSLEFAVDLAVDTGNLLLEYFSQAGIHASTKSDQTVVTEADLAADHLISQKIHESYPHDAIISEESSHSLSHVPAATWVIDPLDGTTNFSLGVPVWGISIARLSHGIPKLGVVYFPLLNELYVARDGSGAYLNERKITTRAPNPAEPMSFFACCSRTFRTYNISIPYKPRILGSSAYSLCLVARGTALLGFEAKPRIWDLAAAWLIVEEAGGIIKPFEIDQIFPIQVGIDYSSACWPVLSAANEKLFENGKANIVRKK